MARRAKPVSPAPESAATPRPPRPRRDIAVEQTALRTTRVATKESLKSSKPARSRRSAIAEVSIAPKGVRNTATRSSTPNSKLDDAIGDHSSSASSDVVIARDLTRSGSSTPLKTNASKSQTTVGQTKASTGRIPQVGNETNHTQDLRNAWGECHAATEDRMMKETAQYLLEASLIDEAQAARLSIPWHTKGVLVGPIWDEKYLDPSKKETAFEIMSIEKARKIQARKDAKEKKFLEDWRLGKIDENGNKITQVERNGPKGSKNIEEDVGTSDADSDIETMPAVKPNAMALPTVNEEAEPEGSSSASLCSSRSTTPQFTAPPPPPTKPTKAPKTKSAPLQTPQPENGTAKYKEYNYYQLAALCRERGLASGGGTGTIRTRLIADDVAVANGTERKDMCKYSRGKVTRQYKTKAPDLSSNAGKAGKRKRSEGDVEDRGRQCAEKKSKLK